MEIRVCFGTFATILNYFRNSSQISQTDFVYTIIKIMGIQNAYTTPIYIGKEIKLIPDKAAISRILKCERDIPHLSESKYRSIQLEEISIDDIIVQFNEVIKYIDVDSKSKIVLALRDIISKDSTLNNEHKETFNIIFGKSQKDFVMQYEYSFSELLSKTFLYTLYFGEKNMVGKNCIEYITKEYIEGIYEKCSHEIEWDNNKQLLTVTYLRNYVSFNNLLKKYDIPFFIEKIDPSSSGIEKRWLDIIPAFINELSGPEFIKCGDCDAKLNNEIVKQIQAFGLQLNEYFEYIGINVYDAAYFDSINGTDVPEDTENWFFPKASLNLILFNKATYNYRKKMVDIYQNIYKCSLTSYT